MAATTDLVSMANIKFDNRLSFLNIKSNVTDTYLPFSFHAVGRTNFDLILKLRQEKKLILS